MKKIFAFMGLSFILVNSLYASSFALTPFGYWKTIDDVTGEPKAILKVAQTEQGLLYGQIVKIFTHSGQDQNEVCTACQDERHNKRIVGMTIMEGLKQSNGNTAEWRNGKILDPLNGKSYNCNVQMMANGQKLKVRGYIGVPLFGRSQTWVRVGGPEGD